MQNSKKTLNTNELDVKFEVRMCFVDGEAMLCAKTLEFGSQYSTALAMSSFSN